MTGCVSTSGTLLRQARFPQGKNLKLDSALIPHQFCLLFGGVDSNSGFYSGQECELLQKKKDA